MGKTSDLQFDHCHPLYLRPSVTSCVALIEFKHTWRKNYKLWSRSMQLALLAKNKLGFLESTCVKSSHNGDLAAQWEQCNTIVLLWIGQTMS